MRVLVVDDSAAMRRLLVGSLQRLGFADCLEAADGREAMDHFDDSVGLVITDRHMAGLDGLDLARALRARADGGRTVPILMVTPRVGSGDLAVALRAGVSGCIVKPFTMQGLKERIDALLAPTTS